MRSVRILIFVTVFFVISTHCMAFNFGNIKSAIKTAGSAVGVDTSIVTGYTYEEEREIGRQLSGSILGAAQLVRDENVQKYINLVGRWVALHSARPEIDWVFGVVDSPTINAFAAPGGFILITKGLFLELENEAQLAAVLAHEISHVTERHRLKLLRKSSAVSLGSNRLGKELQGKAGDADFLVQNLLGNGAEIMARWLDKSAEHEADALSTKLIANAGYCSLGMAEVLQKLACKPVEGDTTKFLFSTHPSPAKRLEKVDLAMTERLEESISSPNLQERSKLYILSR